MVLQSPVNTSTLNLLIEKRVQNSLDTGSLCSFPLSKALCVFDSVFSAACDIQCLASRFSMLSKGSGSGVSDLRFRVSDLCFRGSGFRALGVQGVEVTCSRPKGLANSPATCFDFTSTACNELYKQKR